MKLFALVVLYKPESGEPVILKGGYDLSSFSFFQRTSVQEFIKFTSKIMADKTAPGARQSVKEAEYMCHCFARDDSLAGICMADEEYPHRVAHTLISKILDDFTGQVPRDQWAAGAEVKAFDIHAFCTKFSYVKFQIHFCPKCVHFLALAPSDL